MEDTLTDELFENFYQNSGLPILRAERLLRKCLNEEVRTKDLLFDLRIEQSPQGNKLWEIELILADRLEKQTKSTAFFACHRSKGFITYSIILKGREYWFDRYQAALRFLGFDLESARSN